MASKKRKSFLIQLKKLLNYTSLAFNYFQSLTQFLSCRDKDKDGFLDLSEVRQWILPDDYNHAEAEAKHLVYEVSIYVLKYLQFIRFSEKFHIYC